MDVFSQRPVVAEVEEALARAVAACGLTLHLVDHPEFRNFCTLVARGGQTLLSKDHTDDGDPLPSRQAKLTMSCNKEDHARPGCEARSRSEQEDQWCHQRVYGYCITCISDSWTSPVSTSIINGLACTPVASRLLSRRDGIIKWITSHGKALACFRDVAKRPDTWGSQGVDVPGFSEFVKFCDTRFA
jgi:hypothetical protein